ncbi:MAG: proteasome assembly chaperone family protein [Candidatus Altarchaeaceae archaeon]
MEDIIVEFAKRIPKLKDPVMITGFPGIGFVGKLAVDYLLDSLEVKKLATMYSIYFPSQVIINPDGTIRSPKKEIFYFKNSTKNRKAKNDLLITTGDFQGVTGEGQYLLSMKIVEIAEKFNVKMIYTLGGLGIGSIPEKPKIYGAATDISIVNELKKFDIDFRPGGSIYGAAGLIVGIAMMKNIKGVCLMGETQGELLDPKAAKEVLKKIVEILDIKIDLQKIEEKAGEMYKETEEIRKIIEEQKRQIEQALRMEEEAKRKPLEYIR